MYRRYMVIVWWWWLRIEPISPLRNLERPFQHCRRRISTLVPTATTITTPPYRNAPLGASNDDDYDDTTVGPEEPPPPHPDMRITYNDFEEFDLAAAAVSRSRPVLLDGAGTFYNDFEDDPTMVGGVVHDDDDDKDITAAVTPLLSQKTRDNDSTKVLLDRQLSLQREEQRRVAVGHRNWKLGNWFVRGCSLEHGTNDTTGTVRPVPKVSTIVTTNTLHRADCDYDNDDDDDDDPIDVWVGRTDGSIFGIRLGTDYWTRLGLTDDDDNTRPDQTSHLQHQNTDIVGDEWDNDDDDVAVLPPATIESSNPFTVVTQFQCAGTLAVTSIVAIPITETDDDDATETRKFDLYVARQGSADIERWYYNGQHVSFKSNLSALKSTKQTAPSIVALRRIGSTINGVPTRMLLSVHDSSITLWDCKTDTIMGSIDNVQIPDASGGHHNRDGQTITCVDADDEFIYAGTESGYVLVYAVRDFRPRNDVPSSPCSIVAVGCWRAAPTDDCPVTAIQCGGPGTLGRTSTTTTSTIVYTGDAHGTVKQWEVLKMIVDQSDLSSPVNDTTDTKNRRKTYKVEAWPKLSTQRLRKRAHLFKGHEAAITGLLSVDAMKFVSSSADGTGTFGTMNLVSLRRTTIKLIIITVVLNISTFPLRSLSSTCLEYGIRKRIVSNGWLSRPHPQSLFIGSRLLGRNDGSVAEYDPGNRWYGQIRLCA